jgi:prophage regulatory protein
MTEQIDWASIPATGGVVRRDGLKHATGMSPATVYRQIAKGLFPKPKRLGSQAVGWPQSWIDYWLATRPTEAST